MVCQATLTSAETAMNSQQSPKTEEGPDKFFLVNFLLDDRLRMVVLEHLKNEPVQATPQKHQVFECYRHFRPKIRFSP